MFTRNDRRIRARTLALLGAALVLMTGAAGAAETAKPQAYLPQPSRDKALKDAIAGEWRTAELKARDQYRHPLESLDFWGLKPGMSILEVQPGAGYWTEILAPYARLTKGSYTATAADLDNPELSEGARKAREKFEAQFVAKPETYGKVELLNWGPRSAPPPPDKYDFILVARSIHGWMANGATEKSFRDLFRALKPGGLLAIEQHRANRGEQDPKAKSGYVTQFAVIQMAQKAGFRLQAASEINANPKDTKDHPFGVWTLPPTRTSVPYGSGQPPNPQFDHSKYDAIGESDRMTLRFIKPPADAI